MSDGREEEEEEKCRRGVQGQGRQRQWLVHVQQLTLERRPPGGPGAPTTAFQLYVANFVILCAWVSALTTFSSEKCELGPPSYAVICCRSFSSLTARPPRTAPAASGDPSSSPRNRMLSACLHRRISMMQSTTGAFLRSTSHMRTCSHSVEALRMPGVKKSLTAFLASCSRMCVVRLPHCGGGSCSGDGPPASGVGAEAEAAEGVGPSIL